jgi:hypothetical protein
MKVEPRSWKLLREIVKEKPAKAGNHVDDVHE